MKEKGAVTQALHDLRDGMKRVEYKQDSLEVKL